MSELPLTEVRDLFEALLSGCAVVADEGREDVARELLANLAAALNRQAVPIKRVLRGGNVEPEPVATYPMKSGVIHMYAPGDRS